MARHVVAASMLVSSLLGLSKPAEAQTLDEIGNDTVQAANEANVSVRDLLAAMDTTQLPARAYLIAVGELPVPQPSSQPSLGPPYGAAVAQARCIISAESGGLDVPNRQGSGAQGPGQYFASSWARHVAIYRGVTGYLGGLSLHVLDDVTAVMSVVLPRARAEWSVGGCR